MDYQILLNGIDKTEELLFRIDYFEIIDNSNTSLDSLEIRIINDDLGFAVPEKGGKVAITIREGEEYLKMGEFIVNSVNYDDEGITLLAHSSDLTVAKIHKKRSFSGKTLKEILESLAGDLGLSLELESSLQSISLDYFLQKDETNLEAIARLGELYNAIANLKGDILVFIPKSSQTKEITIEDLEIETIEKQNENGFFYKGVKVTAWDSGAGEEIEKTKGEEPFTQINSSLVRQEQTLNSEYEKILNNEILEIAILGNPRLQAGFILKFQDQSIYEDYSKYKWLVTKAVHSYKEEGYKTKILAIKV